MRRSASPPWDTDPHYRLSNPMPRNILSFSWPNPAAAFLETPPGTTVVQLLRRSPQVPTTDLPEIPFPSRLESKTPSRQLIPLSPRPRDGSSQSHTHLCSSERTTVGSPKRNYNRWRTSQRDRKQTPQSNRPAISPETSLVPRSLSPAVRSVLLRQCPARSGARP